MNTNYRYQMAEKVFQELPNKLYIEIKNRREDISNKVYTDLDLKQFDKFEIITTNNVLRDNDSSSE